MKPFNTPILFLIFNRPDTTRRVFEEIRKIKPAKLFIAADGPRGSVDGEAERCRLAREAVSRIDWPCEVKTLFREKNLGCGYGVSAAITWFFENVAAGIIIEDDCLPDPSFFPFCAELLARYRDDDRIMHIGGNNFQLGKSRGRASYYFSMYTHIWGWATWRRAWDIYDFDLTTPRYGKRAWSPQWLNSVRRNGGLAITPNVNLVSNIGFEQGATHTKEVTPYANLPARSIRFPLEHPKKISRNLVADFFTYRNFFGGTIRGYLFKKLYEIAPKSAQSTKNALKKISRQ